MDDARSYRYVDSIYELPFDHLAKRKPRPPKAMRAKPQNRGS